MARKLLLLIQQMEIMRVTSHNSTQLVDRILWYDGDSTVSEEYITELIQKGTNIAGLCVDKLSKSLEQYNSLVSADQEIHEKTEVRTPNFDFTIPDEYLTLEVEPYVAEKLAQELKIYGGSSQNRVKRVNTTLAELQLYEKLNLFNVLRTLIYIINTFQDKNIVWGVGRGSCVASYVLYLIGVHDVDSVEYDLNITEFLRT